jgi:acetyl-CoA carboxylase biotin carboxyl carrier protein
MSKKASKSGGSKAGDSKDHSSNSGAISMADIAQLKELMALMSANDVTEIIIAGPEGVTIRRGAQPSTVINHQPVIYNGAAMPSAGAATPAPPHHAAPAAVPTAVAAAPAAPAASAPVAPAPAAAAFEHIESPMVGTCYLAPNPDAAPFLKVGQQVTPDTVVCLIEAMKVFNEIKAEKTGVVEQILVKNGQAVEFGQKLYAIR